jgi:hypothetical protein
MSVELTEHFLHTHKIPQDHLNVFLRGHHFMKLNNLSALVPQCDQEVCWIIKRDEYGDIITDKETHPQHFGHCAAVPHHLPLLAEDPYLSGALPLLSSVALCLSQE